MRQKSWNPKIWLFRALLSFILLNISAVEGYVKIWRWNMYWDYLSIYLSTSRLIMAASGWREIFWKQFLGKKLHRSFSNGTIYLFFSRGVIFAITLHFMTYMDNYILEDAVYTRTEMWQTFPFFASKPDIENDYSKWQFFMTRNVDYSRLHIMKK